MYVIGKRMTTLVNSCVAKPKRARGKLGLEVVASLWMHLYFLSSLVQSCYFIIQLALDTIFDILAHFMCDKLWWHYRPQLPPPKRAMLMLPLCGSGQFLRLII